MNRQLLCELRDDDTAESLGAELVREGLINKVGFGLSKYEIYFDE